MDTVGLSEKDHDAILFGVNIRVSFFIFPFNQSIDGFICGSDPWWFQFPDCSHFSGNGPSTNQSRKGTIRAGLQSGNPTSHSEHLKGDYFFIAMVNFQRVFGILWI